MLYKESIAISNNFTRWKPCVKQKSPTTPIPGDTVYKTYVYVLSEF